jgi:hypothetical protein
MPGPTCYADSKTPFDKLLSKEKDSVGVSQVLFLIHGSEQ